jgi:hypothetical protein
MTIRTTVDIPEPLHRELRRRAERSGTSMRSLIIQAIQRTYGKSGKGAYVTGPLVAGPSQPGANFPVDENPHDLVFS